MIFVAQTWLFHLGVGEYLRIRPEPHRKGDPSPDLTEGAELRVGDKPAEVLWADGDAALIRQLGRCWLMSHLRPTEAPGRPAYTPGEGCQEWIVRREVP